MRTSQLALDVRKLVTFTADNPIWKPVSGKAVFSLTGALVRIYPPVGATDELIEQTKKRLMSFGAESVRVMPKPSTHQVVKVSTMKASKMTARKVVSLMVQESNSSDKTDLDKVCSEALSEVGL
jgi:hypothetical protein